MKQIFQASSPFSSTPITSCSCSFPLLTLLLGLLEAPPLDEEAEDDDDDAADEEEGEEEDDDDDGDDEWAPPSCRSFS